MAASWGVIEALPGACLVMDAEGTILLANARWRALAPQCLEGENYLTWLRTLASEASGPASEALDEALRLRLAAFLGAVGDLLEGRIAKAEGEFSLPDQSKQKGSRLTLSPLLAHGAVHDGLALLTHQDVTALQRRADQAEETAHRYDLILSHLPFALSLKDRRLRYMAVNDAFCDTTGWIAEEVIGQTDSALYDPKTARDVAVQEKEILRRGVPQDEEVTVQSNGRQRTFREDKRPVFDHDGTLFGLLGVMTDISGQKKAEQALAEAQEKTVPAPSIQDHFLANISHEIRTPMNALTGLVHLMEQTRLSTRQGEIVARLKGATQSLLSILNDVIDVAALESGQLTLAPSAVHLGELIHALETALQPLAQEQGLAFRATVGADVPAVLVVDGLRLQQILVHLLSNAIKFTPQGEVALVAALEGGQDGQVRVGFSVRDTGIGIAADHQKELFALFHQVDTSLTRRYGGTGLGLALASRLVAMMGGEIAVKSREGEGSTFSFSLSLQLADIAPAQDEPLALGDEQRRGVAALLTVTPAAEGFEPLPLAEELSPGSVAAIDLDDALARLEGDESLLAELLSQFAETHANSVHELLELLDQGNLEQAAHLTHTLKGMAANLGAKALATAADTMTRTARAEDSEGSLALLVGVRRQLMAVLRDIEELVPRLAGPAKPAQSPQDGVRPLDNTGLTSYLKSLEGLLQSNSMAAADAFADIQPALDLLCDRRLVFDLSRFIQRLDYSGALKALNQIVKECEMAQGGASPLP